MFYVSITYGEWVSPRSLIMPEGSSTTHVRGAASSVGVTRYIVMWMLLNAVKTTIKNGLNVVVGIASINSITCSFIPYLSLHEPNHSYRYARKEEEEAEKQIPSPVRSSSVTNDTNNQLSYSASAWKTSRASATARLGPRIAPNFIPVSGSTTLLPRWAAWTSSGFCSLRMANVDSASQFHQESQAKRRSISSRVRWFDSG